MKIIAVASLKGGVGKTSLSAFLSAALSTRGKTLVCDFDANNNLTDYFGRDLPAEEIDAANSYHWLKKEKKFIECVRQNLFLDFLPGSLSLHRLTVELFNRPGALLSVRAAFPKEYKYIVIDTAPSLDWSTMAALYAADIILSPVTFSRWTIQAVNLLSDEVGEITAATGRTPELRLCPSMVTDREAATLREMDYTWTQTSIKKHAEVKTAGNAGRRLSDQKTAWQQFESLAEEVC